MTGLTCDAMRFTYWRPTVPVYVIAWNEAIPAICYYWINIPSVGKQFLSSGIARIIVASLLIPRTCISIAISLRSRRMVY